MHCRSIKSSQVLPPNQVTLYGDSPPHHILLRFVMPPR